MKKIRITTIILVIVLLCLVSFVGVYAQEKSQMKNQVKDYTLGMDIKGGRVLELKVSDKTETVYHDTNNDVIADPTSNKDISKDSYTSSTENVNKDGVVSKENIDKVKSILTKRLKLYGAQEYNVKADYDTGNVVIEMNENTNTDTVVSNVVQTGDFQVIDSQTNKILMTRDDIKSSKVLYNTTSTGTVVYLEIEFTKDGAKKLEDISKTYVKGTSTNNTNTTNETNNVVTNTDNNTETNTNTNTTNDQSNSDTASATEKKIKMTIDGSSLVETSFSTPINDGKLQMSMGSATNDSTTLQKNLQSASSIAYTLDTGKLPIVYTVNNNQFVYSNNNMNFMNVVIVLCAIFAIITLIYLIKYRVNGLLAAISYLGMVAVVLLIIRYTNVILTIESITALGIIAILNFVLLNGILKELKALKTINVEKEKFKKIFNGKLVTFYITLIPTVILLISLSFAASMKIYSFGFMMFWGLALIAIYNLIVTKTILKLRMVK